MKIQQLKGKYAVVKLPAKSKIPDWVELGGSFCSVTHTEDEISIVMPQEKIPENVIFEGDMICFKLVGPLDFSLTGILSKLLLPLAAAKIPVFTIATYETDYIFIHERFTEPSRKILLDGGHQVI